MLHGRALDAWWWRLNVGRARGCGPGRVRGVYRSVSGCNNATCARRESGARGWRVEPTAYSVVATSPMSLPCYFLQKYYGPGGEMLAGFAGIFSVDGGMGEPHSGQRSWLAR